MRCADQLVKIFLAYKSFLLLVDESEEREGVIVRDVGQGLAKGFDCLVYEGRFCQDIGEKSAGFYREHVLLVVGHSR